MPINPYIFKTHYTLHSSISNRRGLSLHFVIACCSEGKTSMVGWLARDSNSGLPYRSGCRNYSRNTSINSWDTRISDPDWIWIQLGLWTGFKICCFSFVTPAHSPQNAAVSPPSHKIIVIHMCTKRGGEYFRLTYILLFFVNLTRRNVPIWWTREYEYYLQFTSSLAGVKIKYIH